MTAPVLPMPATLNDSTRSSLQQKVATAKQHGYDDQTIDGYLRQKFGVGLSDVYGTALPAHGTAATATDNVANGILYGLGPRWQAAVASIAHANNHDLSLYRFYLDAIQRQAAVNQQAHPLAAAGGAIAGALASPINELIPGLGGAKTSVAVRAGRGALGGAIAGGVTAGAGAPAGQVLPDAAKGAALGTVLGGAVGTAAKPIEGVLNYALNTINPSRAVARAAAGVVPADAAARIAEMERLAPGSGTIGALDDNTIRLSRVVGADPDAAAQAGFNANRAMAALKGGKADLGAAYDRLQQTMPVDPELEGIFLKLGEMPPGPDVDFNTLQRIRSDLRYKLRTTSKPSVRRDLGPVQQQLSQWLRQRVPNLDQLDQDYQFVTAATKQQAKLQKQIQQSAGNYAAAQAAGTDAGSVGGSLPSGSRGIMATLHKAIEPDRAARARAVQQMLLTPGDATQAGLAQIAAARLKLAQEAQRSLLSGAVPPLTTSLVGLLGGLTR